jgi:hypothetical protein
MPDTAKISVSKFKDIIYIFMFLIMIITFFIKDALIKDQVRRNTEMLDKYNLEVIVYKIDDLDEKVDKILEILQ